MVARLHHLGPLERFGQALLFIKSVQEALGGLADAPFGCTPEEDGANAAQEEVGTANVEVAYARDGHAPSTQITSYSRDGTAAF